MELRREGRLLDSDLATGNVLSLELQTTDIKKLADPKQRYTMARFMQFRHFRLGWAADDKVHIWLKTPREDQAPGTAANLMLDPGGDLYFTIWDSMLEQAEMTEEFDAAPPFVTSDPGENLAGRGIEKVRISYLPVLFRQFCDPEYL